ncbi:tail fiber domain-containing protein [Lysobacter gummosus]|uniref:Tail fiber domain-containing protein n=1 Tax=Lysobacter gummosus TaxID=262324 RepID=A0ABY3X696_9GAMM|nr:tail fiber domain-containing protein [Lysobacter gummosus]UNP28096.1 tail fiber domain-containing protein [Lysobacter gummosus]
MSGLFITVTSAGYRALVNRTNTGTNPVTVTHIGLSAATFTSTEDMTALPGEFMRLTSFGGVAVAKDTLHLSIRDDGPGQYAYRAFGLYLSDGTLFAIYSQPGVILDKSAAASMLLTADVRFQRIDATTLVFGDTYWLNPPATETVQGVVEIADRVEAIAGTDHTRALTPFGGKALVDARLGENAPSAFVKTLLAAATAVALRGSLGLGSASVRNEGHGNNLDADKLDGEHGAFYRDFGNLTNVPSDFTPKAHRHAWAELDGVPDTARRWPTFEEVTGRPDAYKPLAHTHAIADVNGLQPALDSRANKAHQHDGTDISGRLGGVGKTIGDWNTATENGWYMASGAANAPIAGEWFIGEVVQHNSDWQTQTVWTFASNFRNLWRRQKSGGTWTAWERCHLHESTLDTRYAVRRDNVSFRDVTADRGDGTGVIFLNASLNRYLYWDGTNYSFNEASVSMPGGLNTGSSRHLKTDLQALPYGLAEIERIRVKVGQYKSDFQSDGRRRCFVIAEQLAPIIPEAVRKKSVLFRGKRYAAVEYIQLIPVLIRAVQQLSALVRQLTRRVDRVHQRLAKLERGA